MSVVAVRERPILFKGDMVRAILAGRKTQTRRLVIPTMTPPKVAPLRMEPWELDGELQINEDDGLPMWLGFHPDYPGDAKWFTCPHGGPGWRLWVRESLRLSPGNVWTYAADGAPVAVAPEDEAVMRVWAHHQDRERVNSIHMPRWASRLTLEVERVRPEPVQSITEADAQAEGWDLSNLDPMKSYDPVTMDAARQWFRSLWEAINGPRGYGWARNPWVWAIAFRRTAP